MRTESRERVRKRLNRIAGQVAGLQKMVDEDRYCVDVLTQIAAIRSALDAVGVELLTDHIEHCVTGCGAGASAHAEAGRRSHEQLVGEVRDTLARFLK